MDFGIAFADNIMAEPVVQVTLSREGGGDRKHELKEHAKVCHVQILSSQLTRRTQP